MSADTQTGVEPLVLFCLHYLGGSSREWTQVSAELDGDIRCVLIDLPGFGAAAQTPGYSVAEMAESVAQIVRLVAPRRWMLAGNSMGAKIAAVVARSAEDGAEGLAGLEGLVLLAGSPPGPEPMDEGQRQTMIGWFAGDAASNRAQAQEYIAKNGGELDLASAEQGVTDALRANRSAWVAWLDRGSREDWSHRVGVLQTPALVVAGEHDENLGPEAQRTLTAPHFAHLQSVTLSGARHLLPMERPHDVARLIREHAQFVLRERERGQAIDANYNALINSERVSRGTRAALVARETPDDPAYEPVAMNAEEFATLRAVLQCVVPQVGSTRIDLAARIDDQLGSSIGDGWRFADLPPDAAAYRAGLRTLRDEAQRRYGTDFVKLEGDRQTEHLTRVAGGELECTAHDETRHERLNAKQMRLWFEDLRADAVRLFVAHPRTLARMGYSGIANGGDGEPKTGFVDIGVGRREAWEPQAASDTVV